MAKTAELDGQATTDLIAVKEAELASAVAAMVAASNGPLGGRGKQGLRRTDANIRRTAEHARIVTRLEGELAVLRRPAKPATVPLDLSRLPFAQYIRTWNGWYEVVRVNRKTVKVINTPGMDDLIPVTRIVAIREHANTESVSTPA